MRIDIYHHFPADPDIERKLDRILHALNRMETIMATAAEELANLQKEVGEQVTVSQSILALVEGLAQQIRDNATDPTALRALADSLDANEQQLAAAVAANTPTTPPTE